MVNYWELVATPNTKLLLHLNWNSTDASGNGNNWTDTNITYVNGVFWQGANFNGSSYIRKAQSASLQVTNLTINLWIKKTGGDWWIIGMVCYDNGAAWNNISYFLWFWSDNKLFYIQWNWSADVVSLSWSSTLTADSTWKMITVVRNPTAGTTDFYINWALDVSRTGNTSALYYWATNDWLTIWWYLNAAGTVDLKFIGDIDEVYIRNYAWSATEVLNYYNQSKGVYAPKFNS